MPCTPTKARHLFKSGKARPKRNKLGLFYVQLCYEQEPDNQPLVAGIDPGSKFEGFSVVGRSDTVINLMVEAPDHVKEALEVRRTMRRARRHRKWRRPKRFDNRLNRKRRIPPSTRSRWEAKARVIAHLLTILPLTEVVVEDVQAVTSKGKGGKWNGSFSPVQVGKEHLYPLLRQMGLTVHLRAGWQTKELREQFGRRARANKPLSRTPSMHGCWPPGEASQSDRAVPACGTSSQRVCIVASCTACKLHKVGSASLTVVPAPLDLSEGHSYSTRSTDAVPLGGESASGRRSASTRIGRTSD